MKNQKYHTINGTLEKRFKRRKFVNGVQRVGAAPELPPYDLGAGLAKIGTSTAAGAAGGAAAGGVGAIAGAAGGFIAGLGSEIFGRQAEKDQFFDDKDLWTENKLANLNDIAGLDDNEKVNQTVQTAAKGLYKTGSESVEVERDELVFRKTGSNYNLVADFKDGKTHNEGGENYEATDGDVIVPGKDRDKWMQAYTRKDIPKLEAMRLKLPKDTNVAKDGLDNTDPEKDAQIEAQYNAMLKGVSMPNSGITEQMIEEFAELNSINPKSGKIELGFFDQAKNLFTDLNEFRINARDAITSPFKAYGNAVQEGFDTAGTLGNLAYNQVFPPEPGREINVTNSPVPDGPPAPVAGQPSTGRKKTGGKSTKVVTPSTPANINTGVPGFENSFKKDPLDFSVEPFESKLVDFASKDFAAGDAAKAAKKAALPGKIANVAGYAAQGLSSLSKLFPGEAEVQRSDKVHLDNLKYTDTSGRARQQSELMENVDASNARNASGGNIQNYLANRRQAGMANFRRQGQLDTQEYGKQLNIANQNVGINNQEALYNNQLAYQDSQVNAQNRGARRSYIDQGISELGALGGSIARDTTARSQQEETLKLLESIGLYDRLGQFKTV